ncbi:ash family protein, partial [Escherichia coli]|nr:ash family protein [Escherichia coli]
MHTQKNRLPAFAWSGYSFPAPHKTGAGFRSLLINKAHNRASGFFVRTALPHIFSHQNYGGAYGADFGRAGFSLLTGTANLVRLATHSFAALDGEYSKLTNKEATPWQTVNNSAPALSAFTSGLKSTADSGAHHASRKSCTSTCCMNTRTRCQTVTVPPSSAIWPKTWQ